MKLVLVYRSAGVQEFFKLTRAFSPPKSIWQDSAPIFFSLSMSKMLTEIRKYINWTSKM